MAPTTLQQLNADLGTLADGAGRSLVQVHNGLGSGGAGTIWHPDGLVLTNAHVIGNGPLQVTLRDGTTMPARLLARDKSRDLAALAIDATGLPTIPLGGSKDLRPGQWVLALGHPWGIVGAVTGGVVIGLGSGAQGVPDHGEDWVVVNLQLRPGYSGGPLIDIEGRLVGINTVMTGPEVGMAVPVDAAKAFLRRELGEPIGVV